MKYIAVISALALTSLSSTAHAAGGEGRLEFRSGMAFGSGASEATIGAAAGYDFDLGAKAFAGAEVVADTNTSFETPVYSINARLGAKTGDSSKLYVTAGYAWTNVSGFYWSPVVGSVYVSGTADDTMLGAGFEQDIGSQTYLRLQYSHYVTTGIGHVTVGIGTKL